MPYALVLTQVGEQGPERAAVLGGDEEAEGLADQPLGRDVEELGGAPVGLSDDSSGVGHHEPVGRVVKEVAVPLALRLHGETGGGELVVLPPELLGRDLELLHRRHDLFEHLEALRHAGRHRHQLLAQLNEGAPRLVDLRLDGAPGHRRHRWDEGPRRHLDSLLAA